MKNLPRILTKPSDIKGGQFFVRVVLRFTPERRMQLFASLLKVCGRAKGHCIVKQKSSRVWTERNSTIYGGVIRDQDFVSDLLGAGRYFYMCRQAGTPIQGIGCTGWAFLFRFDSDSAKFLQSDTIDGMAVFEQYLGRSLTETEWESILKEIQRESAFWSSLSMHIVDSCNDHCETDMLPCVSSPRTT
jgi:hypothetical protein